MVLRCTFRNCPVSKQRNPGMHFFQYPVKKDLRNKWLKMTNFSKLQNTPYIQKMYNYAVCARHFRDELFMNYRRDRLVGKRNKYNGAAFAVPTIFRLNEKTALEFEQVEVNKRPTLITLEEPTMPHLIPPPGFVYGFTLHDNIKNANDVFPDEFLPHNHTNIEELDVGEDSGVEHTSISQSDVMFDVGEGDNSSKKENEDLKDSAVKHSISQSDLIARVELLESELESVKQTLLLKSQQLDAAKDKLAGYKNGSNP